MISIRRMSLGAGYRYLMESVAVGDGDLPAASLVDYYAQSGTPPGIFLGAGLAALGDGEGIETGTVVTEEHLFRMLGMCADPLTGKPLGRAPNRAVLSAQKRIAERIAALRPDLTPAERAQRIARVEAEEQARSPRLRPPVAGFDLTFSLSKSVSVAWALADAETKAIIYDCHRRAIELVLAYAERNVFLSRSGTDGVLQEDIVGVIAAAFTHFDSRAGDPQLHDHVVILNRAQCVSDGQWRTLDSKAIFKAVVTLSEMHQGVLSDLLTETLGWGWDGRPRRHSDRFAWEVAGVPAALMAEFARRSEAIEERKNVLIARFVAARGRQPTATEVIRLRQQATLETRPDKTYRSLGDMTAQWRNRAQRYVGDQPESWVASLADRNDLPLLCSEDLGDEILADVARAALERVAGQRATFSRFNLAAEVHRQLHGVRFAHPGERIATAERAINLGLGEALLITSPELHHAPARFLRPDGTSRFRARGHEIYTTPAILEAEARLLDASGQLHAPTVDPATLIAALQMPGTTVRLSLDQTVAIERIATSGRVLDLLVGPAGTGKSTTMAGLRAVWEAEHGPGSVIGLAPSAAAAEVLADELGIECENTAKWLYEHRRQVGRADQLDRLRSKLAAGELSPAAAAGMHTRVQGIECDLRRWQLSAGQLVIVDEASLAGTFALDELVSATGDAGAKIVLVGDPAQLSAVEAGGMFPSLVAGRDGHVAELTDVRRFCADWEKQASVALRAGDPAAIDAYQDHGRIIEGDRQELLDAIYQAWRNDTTAGLASLMIAADLTTVSELNRMARSDLVAAGAVSPLGVDVAGDGTVGVGDIVVTRQNDRTLRAGTRWVRNGDRWRVTHIGPDGSLTVKAHTGRAIVVLPASYVAEHVELGYATTAYRSQGRTVDTGHALVSPTSSREVLYVSATRGRAGNHLYVDCCYDPDPDTGHDHALPAQTAREVLTGVLANQGADLSAHETIRRLHDRADSIATLAPQYQTIATTAQAERCQALLVRSGLSPSQVHAVQASPAYPALTAALTQAEARGLNLERAFPVLVSSRTLLNADDPAAVLHHRVEKWMETHQQLAPVEERLVAGIMPGAPAVTDPETDRGLTEREHAIEHRASALAEQAAAKLQPWIREAGQPPTDPWARRDWFRSVATVAAYRDRWGITVDPRPLGSAETVTTFEQQQQRKRASVALERAVEISNTASARRGHSPGALAPEVIVGLDRGVVL